jgi:hypothetical protein
LGWQAADLLLTSAVPRQIVFQPEVIVRAYTGPAPSVVPGIRAV